MAPAPKKPVAKVVIAIRIDPDLKERLERVAQVERRSLSGQAEYILAEWLERQVRKK